MSFADFTKVNNQLLGLQSKYIAVILFLIVILSQLDINLFSPSFSKKHLQININTATKEEMEKAPYIGEKTAELIIYLRDTNGQFSDINQLKFLPNFAKFKYYIKTEE